MKIEYTTPASEDFVRLSKEVQVRIATKLLWYADQDNPLTFADHLTGFRAYRFRIGIHRIFFEVHSDILFILAIRKRDEAYRRLD